MAWVNIFIFKWIQKILRNDSIIFFQILHNFSIHFDLDGVSAQEAVEEEFVAPNEIVPTQLLKEVDYIVSEVE